jgi:hypothetical protein
VKLEFSGHILENYSNIKFYENPSSGSRVVPCGRTDRHDEANRRFSPFCERAKNTYFTLVGTSCVIMRVRHLLVLGHGTGGSRV